jgi:acyl-CoA thioester hydrolase
MTTPPGRPQPTPRSRYPLFRALTTRWMDNDAYGHLNNVVHYSLFDTAVNAHLIEAGALDIERGEVIGLVVSTRCDYFESLAFPQTVHAGLRLAHRGRTSVRYEVALFGGDAPLAAAVGEFVHVYVDRTTRRPVAALPPSLQAALRRLDPEAADAAPASAGACHPADTTRP